MTVFLSSTGKSSQFVSPNIIISLLCEPTESIHTFDIVDTGKMAFGGSIPCSYVYYERLHTSWLNFYRNSFKGFVVRGRKIIQPFIDNG